MTHRTLLALAAVGAAACQQASIAQNPTCVATGDPQPNDDYVYLDKNWACLDNAVNTRFYVDTPSFRTAIPGLGLDPNDVVASATLQTELVDLVFEGWTKPAPDVQFYSDFAVGSAGTPVAEMVSEITVFAGAPPLAAPADSLVLTSVRTDTGAANPTQVVECDTVVYQQSVPVGGGPAAPVDWRFLEDPNNAGEFVLSRAIHHELGHCMGLGDQKPEFNNYSLSAMWYIVPEGSGIGVTGEDSNAVEYLYGPDDGPPGPPPP